MGDIKLKKGTGILFIMAVLFISSLLYLRYWDQDVLRVGIFYGSNWEVPGTVHYEILDKAIKKFKSKYPNMKVEYEKGILSDDYSEWLSEQILKGEEPDVYLVLDEDFHTLASLGALRSTGPTTFSSRSDGGWTTRCRRRTSWPASAPSPARR